jgi:nonsense-mediated mRNA decay protein 3
LYCYYVSDGLDFFFGTESNARKLVDFLAAVIPIRYNHSKKLISHDDHSNTFNYKVSRKNVMTKDYTA